MAMKKFARAGALVVLAVSLAAVPGFGQYREYLISGRVVDLAKNPLPGVEISLRDVKTSRGYTLKTDKKGEFKFAGLPHGAYKASFRKAGFAAKEDDWKFEAPQDTMQRVTIPDVVLATEAQVQAVELMKETRAEIQEATEKLRQQDFDGAIALMNKVLEKNPQDANALYFLGLSYAKKKMVPEAIAALTKVTELVPRFPGAYFELGLCYQQQGDATRALENYLKNLELDPANSGAAYNAGLILFGESKIDEAKVLFDKALAQKPDDPDFLEMAGRCLIHQADFPKAIELLEKAKSRLTNPDRAAFLDDLIAKLKEQIKK